MKRSRLFFCIGLLAMGFVSAAEPAAYLGVSLDPIPLPKLLALHLKLESGQGLRIRNLHVGSPADRAGLQRHDLIIALNQQPVFNVHRFSEQIMQSPVGQTISLGIIHQGERRNLDIELAERPGDYRPRYDLEPSTSHRSHPRRIYRLDPGKDQWVEMDPNMEIRLPAPAHPFAGEIHIFTFHSQDSVCTVTLHGDPQKGTSRLSVSQDGTQHSARISEIDTLPPDMQIQARRGLKQAREMASQHRKRRDGAPLDHGTAPPRPLHDESQERIERLEEELQGLRDRIRAMETATERP